MLTGSVTMHSIDRAIFLPPNINSKNFLEQAFKNVFPCKYTKACTIIENLTALFRMFGVPGCLHSDQRASFMSYELKSWFHSMDIPTCKSNRYVILKEMDKWNI